MSNSQDLNNNIKSFDDAIIEVIKNRSSKRTYQGQPLKNHDKEGILSFIESGSEIFPAKVRFGFVETSGDKDKKLGTYGVIKGSRTFLVSAVKEEKYNMEELGYRLERGVLYATAHDLGTCWLAGTFNRSDFGKAIGLKSDETIPAISPVGMATEKRRLLDSTMRTIVGSTSRKKWEELFFDGSFSNPLTEKEAGTYAEVLEMVRIGPSASNKQPWRIVRSGGAFHFYLAHSKNYPATAQRIDIGIAVCHFELTAKQLGLEGKFKIADPEMKSPENVEYIISWV